MSNTPCKPGSCGQTKVCNRKTKRCVNKQQPRKTATPTPKTKSAKSYLSLTKANLHKLYPPSNKSSFSPLQPKKRCPKGTQRNKQTGNCDSIEGKKSKSKHPSPVKSPHQRHTSSRRHSSLRKKKSSTREEWNSEVDREFKHILAELRDGKLKKMHPYQPPPQPINAACIKQLTTHELQAELDLRKTQEQHINMLIPRKKIKK